MVRFIIYYNFIVTLVIYYIYIPIWLDLLFARLRTHEDAHAHLHSNMVRFIILAASFPLSTISEFTFQYG